jgi:plastocyanin
MVAHRAQAQGTVTGQITIQEKPGERGNDLSDAVVYLVPDIAPKKLEPTSSQIAMHGRAFNPRVRVVTVGSSVSFANEDPFRHNAFSVSGPNAFDLGLYGRGESKAATLTRSGAYPFFCNVHAKMSGYVVAVPTPYFTQPQSDGRFALQKIPAGKYTLRVWHERGGVKDVPIDVTATESPALAISLDARGYKPVPHKNKFGQDYPVGADRY